MFFISAILKCTRNIQFDIEEIPLTYKNFKVQLSLLKVLFKIWLQCDNKGSILFSTVNQILAIFQWQILNSEHTSSVGHFSESAS